MPVILDPNQWEAWLSPQNKQVDTLLPMIRPHDSEPMQAWPASRELNRVGLRDDEGLIGQVWLTQTRPLLPVTSRWANGRYGIVTSHRRGNHSERQLSRNATACSRHFAVLQISPKRKFNVQIDGLRAL